MDLGNIDRIVVKRFYRNLPNKLSQSSKNLILQILRATLSEAYQESMIDFIPAFPRRERAKEPVKNALPFAGAINKTGPVFPVCSNDYLNRVLKTACEKAEVLEETTHEFGRHSFVSQLLPHFTQEQVAMITNNLSSLPRYAHMDLEQKRKIINSNRSLMWLMYKLLILLECIFIKDKSEDLSGVSSRG